MRVVIGQAAHYLGEDEGQKLLDEYPYLRKYEAYYHQNYDGAYWKENVIIKDMDDTELKELIDELTKSNKLVIGYEDKYNETRFGTNFGITIYDDYL